MKILIVDDKEKHRSAAQKLLGEHDLTIVGSYSLAKYCFGYVEDDAGVDPLQLAQSRAAFPTNSHNFDVVITDLVMPCEKNDRELYEMTTTGQEIKFSKASLEIPYGIAIAQFALRANVPKIAILTNGHNDLNSKWIEECIFEIPGKLWFFNDNNCPQVEYQTNLVKDWKTALEKMLE